MQEGLLSKKKDLAWLAGENCQGLLSERKEERKEGRKEGLFFEEEEEKKDSLQRGS